MQKLCFADVVNGPTLDQLSMAFYSTDNKVTLRLTHPGTLEEIILPAYVERYELEDGSGHRFNLEVHFSVESHLDPVLEALSIGTHRAFYDAARRTGSVQLAAIMRQT